MLRKIAQSFITEITKIAKQSEFKQLQSHKVPLSSKERSQVMQAKAVWHHGPNGEPTPAVWKSLNPKTGKINYISNTHRCYQSKTTLPAAIAAYHKVVEPSA